MEQILEFIESLFIYNGQSYGFIELWPAETENLLMIGVFCWLTFMLSLACGIIQFIKSKHILWLTLPFGIFDPLSTRSLRQEASERILSSV